ncbi:hypothetical protein DFH09DRAFT_1092100 [Mycena vulgaris]|nr:hypothetical protein DFH09DRAFT_1092100 [Mycena vulgaris]
MKSKSQEGCKVVPVEGTKSPKRAQQERRMERRPEQTQGPAEDAIWGPRRAENPKNELGNGNRKGQNYSQKRWGARRKSRGQQGLRYGACGGRKIPKTSWAWMHPHHRDVTYVGAPTVSLVEGSTCGGYTHHWWLVPSPGPT